MAFRDGRPSYVGPLHFNGVNGATGRYGLELDVGELTEILRRDKLPTARLQQPPPAGPTMRGESPKKVWRGVKHGVDPKHLDQAGWGIVFVHGDPLVEAKKAALDKLIQHRKAAGTRFRLFEGSDAYRPKSDSHPGESVSTFLGRFNAQSGPVDPDLVPYYLLLVGSPEQIPFEFQYNLDVDYAVGRLDFPEIEDFATYAAAVVTAETTPPAERPRRVRLFGVTNPDDTTTAQTTQHLVLPLERHLRTTYASAIAAKSWDLGCITGDDARRSRLLALLDEAPDLLVTASHGVEFPPGDDRQRKHQGALLCSDWPGPDHAGSLPETYYLAGEHLPATTRLNGMISFHYACYAAGTPTHAELDKAGTSLTDKPFLAALPQDLLRRGALAVVGHVDRAYGYSFMSSRGLQGGERSRIVTFTSAFDRLFAGEPLGRAIEDFNSRSASLAASLLTAQVQGLDLVDQWTELYDARNYVILGDPAVRLPAVANARSSGLFRLGSDKPLADLDDADWRDTPQSVKRRLSEAVELLRELRSRLDSWEK